MFAPLFLLAIHDSAPVTQVRSSRASFVRALSQVHEGWTKEQVRRLLGPADDVWPKNGSRYNVTYGNDTWCYGTNGRHTMPTLGFVIFSDDAVEQVAGGLGTPPPTSVISEAELEAALRALYRNPSNSYDFDPQRIIRAANLLIGKGRSKALAILSEYGRIGDGAWDQTWLFWLVRTAFTPRDKNGVFKPAGIGAMYPPPPANLRSWPTYPIVVSDDIPFCFVLYEALGGVPERFERYVRQNQENWTLRRHPLRPPDNPFTSFRKLVASSAWPLPSRKKEATGGHSSTLGEQMILGEVLSLVHPAYQPVAKTTRLDLDRYEREFRRIGGHWNTARQMYVRRILQRPAKNDHRPE